MEVYEIPHFVNGKHVTEEHMRGGVITHSATGGVIGHVSFASQALITEAVSGAQKAFITWSQTTPSQRVKVFFAFRNIVEQHKNVLAHLLVKEHGKTLEDALGSIARGLEVVEWYCGYLHAHTSDFSHHIAQGVDCYTIREPLGVCLGITPFNFPVMVPLWMLMPAIAAGNTFILKPSEQDSSAALQLCTWLVEAGLPSGVVQCLQGDRETVDSLLHHSDIAAVTAVASTPVAEYIYQTAIQQGKRAQTFGGAKNHAVVMPDADMVQAAQAIVGAAYGAAGERCMAISVVMLVGDATAQSFLEAFVPQVRAIRIDIGDAPEVDMGPLISNSHRSKVLAAIEKGCQEGAELLLDGRDFEHPQYPEGFFLGPTLFDKVTESMTVYQEEIFGPVLCIMRVPDLETALACLNRHPYGNGAAIFTQHGATAQTFIREASAGMIGVNVPIPVPIVSHPFGGWKRSSFGDTNMHAMESLHFYTKRKTVTMRWPKLAETASFQMPSH
ncbi:MAG: CoA-acylating methylmalonate-semialdehyde dehydrogenase [Legionellaceae bacterium]|nr:CoA-acylating methylmalonate-semialdehyde dehydrogenase [Legionellaceae bacterium]